MEKKDHVLLGAALTVGAVEDWLGEHVDPETGYVVDDTLAIEGAAADAKATGEAIAAVEAAIPAVDATLATTGAAADAKKVGDELTDLKSAFDSVDTKLDIYKVPTAEDVITPTNGNGYAYGTGTSYKIYDTTGSLWVQKLYAVEANVPYRITSNLTVQAEAVPEICFATEWTANTVVDPIAVNKSGNFTTVYTPSSNGYIAVLYSVNGSVKATDTVIGKADYEFVDFQDEIDDIEKILIHNTGNDEWEIGTLNNGVYGENAYRITDVDYIPIFKGCTITSSLQFVVHYYDANKSYITNTGWQAAKSVTTISNENYAYFRIALKVSDNYAFTEDDLVTYAGVTNITYPIASALQDLKREILDSEDDLKENVLVQSFNSAYHTGATSWATKTAAYNQLFNDSANIEAFMFFTDPHFYTRDETVWQKKMPEFIAEMQKYYNSTPASFCLCGGDWLTSQDSNSTALFRLGYVDGFMNAMFENYYPMFGNHDDNYQGATTDGGEAGTATPLDKQTIVNLWFKKYGKAYYTFSGTSTKFYVFDTGSDWSTSMTDYRWEQVDWFATALLSDAAERIAVAAHIVYNNATDYTNNTLTPMMDNIGKVIEAYNGRTSVTLNSKTYDFTSATGSVMFIVAGHLHQDGSKTVYGVPCVLTTNTLTDSTKPTFDLFYVDYDNEQIETIRIGSGSNRTISL